jgi:Cysteine-rich secretory protein family
MINKVRSEKAGDYTLDTNLVSSSTERANYLGQARKFKKMHQRPGQTCKNYRCYDLAGRFTERGVSASAGESIGYGGYSCKKEDCTDALIEASKKTFRFFMSEAKRNGPHYQMVVSGKYSKVGIGIAPTKASRGNAYVLVMHVSN